MSPEVNDPGFRAISFEQLRVAYKQQAEALIDGGVDILLVETIFDTLNAKAALFAIDEIKEERNLDIPIMISGTITDASGQNAFRTNGRGIFDFNFAYSTFERRFQLCFGRQTTHAPS